MKLQFENTADTTSLRNVDYQYMSSTRRRPVIEDRLV